MLSQEEEEILSTLMTVEWINRETNRLLDIRMGLSDTDFKRYSEANNLKSISGFSLNALLTSSSK